MLQTCQAKCFKCIFLQCFKYRQTLCQQDINLPEMTIKAQVLHAEQMERRRSEKNRG